MKFSDSEIIKFLSRLQENNIVVLESNNNLQIIDKNDSITEEILLDLSNNKAQILRILKQNIADEINIKPIERGIDLPLSFAQERLWFIDQYAHNDSYNMSRAVKLIGKLEISVLENTFSEIIRRHEVLRTNFVTINETVSQLIHKKSKFELRTVDQSSLPKEEANQQINDLVEIESQIPFDLANDSLIRLVLYKLSDEEHILFLNKHHIISDGWSFSVFLKEISILYKAFSENKPSPLPELEIQYADYAVWQRENIEGEVLNKQLEYWKDKLSGTAVLELPTDRPRPVEQTFNGSNQPFSLDKAISEKLNGFSKDHDVTLFMTLLSAFKVLLKKYTGQDDICVGTPIANRTISEIEPLIGFFVNSLALRSYLSGNIRFIDLVKQVKQTALEAYANQDMPFEKVVDIVQQERNLSYSPLFQVMVVLQNNPVSEVSFGELNLSPIEFESTVSKFDLTINFTETAEGLVGGIEYNTDLFNKDSIERMIGHFKVLIESIISKPEYKISELEILTSVEKHQLLVEWNDTEVDYPKDKCIHQLFEEQVEKTPSNVAVVFDNKQLIYRELNKKSNQLARCLQSKGVKPDAVVGICLGHSLEMIVGLLGILKAGGAYVPFDPSYPQDRISYMLENTDCKIVLSQEHIELPKTDTEIINLDADWDKIENESPDNAKSKVKSNNLAYVIYTSGSTGRPKGVCVEHNMIINTLFWRKIYYNLNHRHSLLLTSSFAFDSSVEIIWGSLISCSKLIIIPKEQITNFIYWSEILRNEENINLLMIPSLYKIFLENYHGKFDNIKSITIAGESFSKDIVLDHFQKHNSVQLFNEYGPTENSVCTSVYKFNKDVSNVLIGKPIYNTKIFILDNSHNLQPIGISGELYISGDGLAREYLKHPEYTKEKFIKNPFSVDQNSRLFKTGDLARFLPDGNIEFIGRIDNQVKIRGFRIELGEIESTIQKIEIIKDCVVVVKEKNPGNKRLVAYVVSDGELNVQELRDKLSKSLPDYMVPSFFVSLEKIPLSPNGKIDKKALPEPEGNIEATHKYVAPRTETERKLVAIWTKVLGVKKVGIHDNFFELGGHSLLATQLISKIRTDFNIELPLKTIFKKSEIFSFSKIIENTKSESKIPKITSASRNTDLPLSFAQERLWFIDQYDHNASYNMPGAVKLIGKLDIEVLKKTFSEIIRRHEILRTNFVAINNETSQLIHEESKFELKTVDQSHLPVEEVDQSIRELIEIESRKTFDLACDSLIRLVLCKINDEEHTLFLNQHHIISDGWSSSIFYTEISILYKAFSKNKRSPLPELEIQYADYSVWQRENIDGDVLRKQSDYWKNKLSGVTILELPTDKTRPTEQTFKGTNLHFNINREIVDKLNAFCKENDITLFMTLLSVFNVLLNKYSGQVDICVGSPIANRTRSEIEPLIGFFVNMLSLRSDLSGNLTFLELLKQVKQTTLDAYSNQDIPFEKVVDIVNQERNLYYTPLFQVTLTLQNTPESELYFGDLQLKPIEFETNFSKFDLSIDFTKKSDGLAAVIEYNTDLFDKDRIERMAKHFNVLIESIIANPEGNISEFEILTSAEKHQLLLELNNTASDYPKNKCIHQLFEEQVEKTPGNIAVVFEEEELTYHQLNIKANQLAHYLQAKVVKPDSLVGICVDRSLDMIIGILGILKAGGAYVPIDPTYPDDRISYMLEDTECDLVLGHKYLQLPKTNSELIYFHTDWDKIENEPIENVSSEVNSNNLAYVIYTSGSTGRPKGVMIEHVSVVNTIKWFSNRYGINKKTKVLQSNNFIFDASVEQIFGAILNGAELFLIRREMAMDPISLYSFLKENSINILDFTPVMLKELLCRNEKLPELKTIISGGENLEFTLKEQILNLGYELHNHYGPTEITIETLASKCSKIKVVLGKPISNLKIYILDSNCNLQPIGVPGELCVSGVGLARGYLKRPELTAEKFIKNPFSDDPNSRLYKTGDIVRQLSDGNIEFLGRIDNQVKIRGFRIELGEIESYLLKHDKVDDAIISIVENSKSESKKIAAYIKINKKSINQQSLNQRRVEQWLSIYDESYSNMPSNIRNDFTGWNSSYTGLPISEDEMLEWLDRTTDLIKKINPRNVFEIGCGNGLVLFNLAGHFNKYYASDFSKESVNYVEKVIETDKINYKDVKVYHNSADNIKDIELKEIDTIIINSVVQYFPSLQYLEQVVIDSIEKIEDSGVIIIGDVRDYKLLEDYYRSIELYKIEDDKSIQDLNQRIKNGIKNEEELLIDPQYFVSLYKRFQKISHVDIRYKQGIYQTEMNKYRYDVIIHINKEATKNIDRRFDWDNEKNINKELQKVLKEESPDAVCIDNVPNFYLEEDKNLAKKMKDDQVSIKELKLLVKNEKIDSFNTIFNSCSDEYSIEIAWNSRKYLCNVLLVKKTIDGKVVVNQSEIFWSNEFVEYSNDTLKKDFILESKNEIKKYLEKKLPEYMIPSYFIEIEEIPLTQNGKVDKKALPQPEIKAGADYRAPSNEIEETLIEIWGEVLDLDKNEISINKSFFELGGNSILSVTLQQKLSQLDEFKNISIPEIFKYHTINLLVKSIQKDKLSEYKLRKNTHSINHEIAIIGMSGAFSGAENIAEFWQLIKNQDEGIRFYSKDESEKLGVDISTLEEPDYIPVSGKVKDIDLFDPLFWNLSPNDAKMMDPQIRKFVEHCWFVLESSGYVQQRREHNIGVFAGSGREQYFYSNILNGEMASQINLWEALNVNSKDALATKTSYLLDLSGPSNSINTACSTGLVSVVEACKNLQLMTCDMALAGGVSLSMPNQIGYKYQEGMVSSKDGHCRTFDKDASGSIVGSGVGVVLLKRLEDAVKNNDNIIGVIKGYSTNNDGARKTSYTAPSVIGQGECIFNAQKMARISSCEIDYVECHGMATILGDSIEVQALKEAFELNKSKGSNSKHKTVLGTVKANIGHADAAAGTAGLIKACLMLQNNMIPGQTNYNTPNPKINIDQTNFEIIKVNRKWSSNYNKQRIAGVSSFGIGGTNAHVIIGEYIPDHINHSKNNVNRANSIKKKGNSVNFVVPISAKSKQSLDFYKQQLIKYIAETKKHTISIEDLAYTLQERREHFNYRCAYSVKNIDELKNSLKIDSSFDKVNSEYKNKTAFMFPGQGSQYACMAKGLYDNDQFFKKTIDKLISLANQNLDVDLFQVMYPNKGQKEYHINETRWAQISIFIIEYALAKYLEHLGIRGDAYIGHSIGEYTAATLSKVFSLEDAIKIVIARGNIMQSMQPGSMLAITTKEETISSTIEDNNCEIAVINSIDELVVSGDDDAINALKATLDKQAIPSVILNTSHAYHSKMMEDALNEFETVFSNIKLNKPKKIFISNVTGEIANEEVTNASYWSRQLRETVQFAKGINCLAKKYHDKISFIEVGTGKGLSSFVTKYKNTDNIKNIQTLQLLPSKKDLENKIVYKNIECKEDIIAKLWSSGTIDKPNDVKLFKQANLLTDFPTYQFDFKKCWLEKGDDNALNNQLKILPKEKWLYTPVWSTIANLNKLSDFKPPYKKALVFIRKDQLNSFDFTCLALDNDFIILDTNEMPFEDIGNPNRLFLKVKNEDDFKKLAKHLKKNDNKYDAIIHASSINNTTQIDDALSYSFYSLFLIHKYLLNTGHLKNILVLTNGLAQITNEDIINPANGTLVGAVRTINHEFPYIDARVIDIGPGKSFTVSLINQVIYDDTYRKSEELLAIKFGKLWKECFNRIENSISEVNLIENGDIILVTGGLGGIALAIANYISSKHKVTFVLVSRNDISKDTNPSEYIKLKKEIIEKIKANGSVVDIQNIDISDEQLVIELKEQIDNKYGYINGIIHTAGVSPLSIDKYDLDSLKNAFKGKVNGVHNIINTFNLSGTRFIASTSSLASIMGDNYQIDYCASNSYLDYLSIDKIEFKNIKTLSINWPGWSGIGMVKDSLNDISEEDRQTQGIQKFLHLNYINQNEGAEIFYQLINQSNFDQVIISKIDIHDLKNKLFFKEQTYALDSQLTIKDESYTDTEFKIAQIWSQVLGIEEFSIHDNFFELGGHSLKATVLTSNFHKEFGVKFPLRDVFLHQTIKSQASQIATSTKKEFESIPKAKEQSNYPLSSAQKRLYLLQQFDLGSTAYNMPGIIPLGTDTDKGKIEEVFKQLINRHESFRTSINIVDQVPVQKIHDQVEFKLEELSIELGELENTREQFVKPFDLSQAPFLRVAIVDIKGEDSLLMIDMHHVISDGTSHAILEQEFHALLSGEELAPLPLQYRDYSEWQNSKEQQEVIKGQEEYWLKKFEGEIPVLNLPTDYVRPLMQSHEGATVRFALSKEETDWIKSFTKDNGLTLYMSLLSVFNILLSKLSGQDDIVVGTPIAGRNHVDLENIVGMFVNTLSIRNEVKGEETIQEFVSRVKQTVLGAFENQNYQFEDLVDKVSIERDTSHNPIFNVMFNLLNQAEYSGDISGFNTQNQVHEIGMSKFDLTLAGVDYGEQLLFSFTYCTKLFNSETIDRYISYFKKIIVDIGKNNNKLTIKEVEIIPEIIKQKKLSYFNENLKYKLQHSTIQDRLNESYKEYKDKVAIEVGDKYFTYSELEIRKRVVSNWILQKNIKKESLVGILVNDRAQVIISILGILDSSCIFVPIDINLPDNRIKGMIESIGINYFITCDKGLLKLNKILPEVKRENVFVYDNDVDITDVDFYEDRSLCTDAIYIYFTSGSTGKPKPIVGKNESLLQFIEWELEQFNVDDSFRVSQLINIGFDVYLRDIFLPLVSGGTICIPLENNIILDGFQLTQWINRKQITLIHCVSSVFNVFGNEYIENSSYMGLRYVLMSGEQILPSNLIKWYSILGNRIQLVNLYGPTETTLAKTCYFIKPDNVNKNRLTIGQAIVGSRIIILDKNKNVCDVGIPGELYIRTAYSSLGYYNDSQMTREKFVDNPFKKDDNFLLYRTGDVAIENSNGEIEIIGRIDHQVKIRGFRIELGEIESTLLKYENIKESVVLAREENGDKYLCAYIVGKEELNHEELRTYMLAQLPDYMVPTYFVELESLPLNPNGKVNRRALPSPEVKAGEDYIAPSNEIEEKLVKIWSDILNIEKENISVDTDFFSIGGHSLKATVLTNSIHKELGVEFPLHDVFLHSTIKGQCSLIKASQMSKSDNIEEDLEYENIRI
jgi:amino acid adenylation domain-containing protein